MHFAVALLSTKSEAADGGAEAPVGLPKNLEKQP